ncbi:MAG TPA: hypothetical protein VHS74_03060 [Solirubrobacterales bacterium]|jgi:hypothetical protein|nr:hypothetical protein [Solirubrobacterales bacterium]
MRRLVRTLLGAAAATLILAAPARADFGLGEFNVTFTEEDGSPATQAGSHPFAMTTSLALNSHTDPVLGPEPDGEIKDLTIEQPVGLAGDPKATPRCSTAQFLDFLSGSEQSCPDSTVVGTVTYSIFGPLNAETVPVYNLTPSSGAAAELGFKALVEPVTIEVTLSESPPYNISATLMNVPQAVPFFGSKLTLWGDPADPAHDPFRGNCLAIDGASKGDCPTSAPPRPFLTLTRSCQGPLTASYRADSWQNPGAFVEGSVQTHDNAFPPQPLGMSGCSKLNFSPRVSAQPTSSAAESPSGLQFDLNVPDEGLSSPSGIAGSDIKEITTLLPPEVSVNPSAAEGLGACSPADYARERVDTTPGGGCPSTSKLGTVEVETPLLEDEPLKGSVYLATPNENPFDSLIALYLVIKNPELGIIVKQAGKVEPLPSGQLLATFKELPQLPFNHLELRLNSGPRAPLVTPAGCGTYNTNVTLVPWSGGESLNANSSFQINAGEGGASCPSNGAKPFSPEFTAGTTNNAAGSYSPFYMRLSRGDGEQEITRFSSVLPPGVVGKLTGIERCSDAAIAAARTRSGRAELASPSCPAGSKVGTVSAGAGVGAALTFVQGKIYLAGPFGSSPLSVVVITPAVAGPFDLGTVVVREGLNLDPNTAEVVVDGRSAEPIPHSLLGIPLKLRDLRVNVDREQFTLNATSCEPETTRATIFGSAADLFNPEDDSPTARSSRYQAADCANLGFKPKLSLALKGATKRTGNPSLQAVLTTRPGDANLKGAEVILPRSQFIDNAHINNPCTRVQFNAGQCPKASVLGTARVFTPLLPEPLEGPVYFRSNGGERELPDIVADLHGQFRFDLVIAILHAQHGRIRTKVLNAPDAPVSKFVLRMAGGKKGLLENSQNLCAAPQHLGVDLSGQNGRRYDTARVVGTSCGKKKRPVGTRK